MSKGASENSMVFGRREELMRLLNWILTGLFHLAQKRAERLALRQRKAVLTTDHWLDEQLGFAGAE